MSERWLPVVGFEGKYEVSDMGRVKSLARTITLFRHDGHTGQPMWINYQIKQRIMKLNKTKKNYLTVMLGCKGPTRRVHQLVLESFIGPCPAGHEALHANDIKGDNTLSNLSWGTKSDNQRDAIRNGRSPIGEHRRNAKLKNSDIPTIRVRLNIDSCYTISQDYNVSENAIRNIKLGISWSHVP